VLGTVLYWRPRTALLRNTCFLHAAQMPPSYHRLTHQPILTYCLQSITLQSAFASDAVARIPAGSIRLCSAITWSHRRSLFPYPAKNDGGDSLLDYSIQNDNLKNRFFFATKNRFSKTNDFNVPIVYMDTAQELLVKQLFIAIQVCSVKCWSPQNTHGLAPHVSDQHVCTLHSQTSACVASIDVTSTAKRTFKWNLGVGPCTETTSCYTHLTCLACLSVSRYCRCCGWAVGLQRCVQHNDRCCVNYRRAGVRCAFVH